MENNNMTKDGEQQKEQLRRALNDPAVFKSLFKQLLQEVLTDRKQSKL